MKLSTYQTVSGHKYEHPNRTPQADTVTPNAAAMEVPRWIQHHAAQVDQCQQMVNAEDILKQKLLDSLDEKYFKGQLQASIRYCICYPRIILRLHLDQT